jgi:hypothetical protein
MVAAVQIQVQVLVEQNQDQRADHRKKRAGVETPSLLALYKPDLQMRNPLKK